MLFTMRPSFNVVCCVFDFQSFQTDKQGDQRAIEPNIQIVCLLFQRIDISITNSPNAMQCTQTTHIDKSFEYCTSFHPATIYRYFFGAPPLLFLYTRYAPTTMTCTANAMANRLIQLNPCCCTTALTTFGISL